MGNVSPNDIPDWMHKLSPELPARIERFLCAVRKLGVRRDERGLWQLKWDYCPAGDLLLGYLKKNGQVWTETLGDNLDHTAIAECAGRYKEHLATLWGGVVKDTEHRTFVADANKKVFLIQDLDDEHFNDWIKAINAFQQDVRNLHKNQA